MSRFDSYVSLRRFSSIAFLCALTICGFLLVGCGSGSAAQGGSPVSPVSPEVAPTIVQQPTNASVPMGLAATYAVSYTGSTATLQWLKNGSPIAGANSPSYTTPATAFADNAATFTVSVSNAAGSVTSSPASLTVTARAPMAGDLRFHQVDSEVTVNGYGNANPSGKTIGLPVRNSEYVTYSLGTPTFIDPLSCNLTGPPAAGVGCTWQVTFLTLVSPPSNLSLSGGFASGELANLQTDLAAPTSFSNLGATPLDAPNSVITSLDLEPVDGFYAASYTQNPALAGQSGGFDLSQQTVAPGDLAAAAAQEGARSRVITAVGFNAGQVVYFSYGWQGDTTTLFETSVVAATSETMAPAAAGLAANGYIITAIGGSNVADSYVLIGTRVQGDTMARPFLSGSSAQTAAQLFPQGYAIVGVVVNGQTGLEAWLGER